MKRQSKRAISIFSYTVFLFIIIEKRFIKINSHWKNIAIKEIVFVNTDPKYIIYWE